MQPLLMQLEAQLPCLSNPFIIYILVIVLNKYLGVLQKCLCSKGFKAATVMSFVTMLSAGLLRYLYQFDAVAALKMAYLF